MNGVIMSKNPPEESRRRPSGATKQKTVMALLMVGVFLALLGPQAARAQDAPIAVEGQVESRPGEDLIPFQPDASGFRGRGPSGPRRPGFKIGAEVQMDGGDGSLGSTSRTTALPAVNGIAPFPAETSLYLRRLRLSGICQITPGTRLVARGQFEGRNQSTDLLDLYLETRPCPGLELTLGQFKPRWGWEFRRHQWTGNTIEWSDATTAYARCRDIGLNAGLNRKPFTLDVGVFGAQGVKLGDLSWSHLKPGRNVIARFEMQPVQGLFLGFSGQAGTYARSFGPDLPVQAWNLGMRGYRRPMALEAEVMWGRGYNSFSRGDTISRGGCASLLCEVARDLDLVIGHDWFDPDTRVVSHNPAEVDRRNSRRRTTLGVNWYVGRRSDGNRLMLNYEFRGEGEGPSFANDGLRLRYQRCW
jgi:hypothetical protein